MADANRPLLNWWSPDEIQLSPETGKLLQELFQEHGEGDDNDDFSLHNAKHVCGGDWEAVWEEKVMIKMEMMISDVFWWFLIA